MVRLASRADAETVADVAAAAFGFAVGGERWQGILHNVSAAPHNFLVVEAGGEIVGSLHLLARRMHVEDAEVVACDVHDVCVRPDMQGRGLGTELMHAAVDEMKRRGVHLSRLGGYAPFYSRFGYARFPRGMYVFPVEPMEAGATLLGVEEVFALPPAVASLVRPYDPRRDWHVCQRLWQEFYAGRTGASVREYHPDAQAPQETVDARAMKFVYDDGQVRGYVFAAVEREGLVFRPCDGRIAVTEAAFEPDCPQALWAPLKKVLQEAARRNCWRVTARLPFDVVVERALGDGAIAFKRVELVGGPASNMIRVIDLPGLLEAIAPVLGRRAAAAEAAHAEAICLRVANAAAHLIVDDEVRAERCPGENCGLPARVTCDSAAFTAMLLGLRQWEQVRRVCRHELSAAQHRLMNALFPPQPTATGLWG